MSGVASTDPGPQVTVGTAGPDQRGSEGSWIAFAVTMAVLAGSAVVLFLPLIPEALGLAACAMMLALLFLRVPIAVAMIVPSLLGMYALRGFPLVESTLTTLPFQQVASWSLSVVPMFILMGLMLWRAGLTESLYLAARHWLGWLPGGLAVGTNLAGAGLASVSGSTVGTTYALARIGVPEMLKAGYDRRMAIGAVVVAGLPGQLIPPSLLLVIYAGIAEVPIGPQLLAGIGPGILVALMFTIMIVVFARAVPSLVGGDHTTGEVRPAVDWGARFRSLAGVWPVPVLIGVIVVGMFTGTFTATEAGAVAAVFSVVVTLVWKRGDQPFRTVVSASVATVASVGAIFLMLIGAAALARMLTLTGISTGFAGFVESLDLGRVQFLLVMMVVYLVLGMFMEPLAMMVLTVPILLPTLESLEISPLWFGVFVVLLGELAIVTPPVGILSFIIHGVVRDPEVNRGVHISLNDIFKAVLWFIPMAIVVLLLLIFFPEIALYIPDRAAGP